MKKEGKKKIFRCQYQDQKRNPKLLKAKTERQGHGKKVGKSYRRAPWFTVIFWNQIHM